MADSRGGARPGAGRKPTVLKFAEQATAMEMKIVEALPKIVDKMIEQALAGDVRASKYLIDRILGRVAKADASPAEDRSMPVDAVAVNDGAAAVAEVKAAWNGSVETASTPTQLARSLIEGGAVVSRARAPRVTAGDDRTIAGFRPPPPPILGVPD